MGFQEISSKIIKESINAAVYIDDRVLMPFELKDDSLIDQSALFFSFRENNCYLDFNRYSEDQPKEYRLLLNNKDLLILNWHLSSNEGDLSATFRILETAINTQCLHFCVIYTEQRKDLISERVILNVASYFSGLDKKVVADGKKLYENLIDSTGLSDEVQREIKGSIKRLTTELFFEFRNKARKKEISRDINNLINQIGKEEFEDFLDQIGLPENEFKERLICLSFILNECAVPDVARKYKRLLSPDRYTIRINNLYIKVFSKGAIKDTELYDEFTNSLVSESNIFLTLLGLEIRNRFRETSGFIGKELDDLNELAFFHHRKNHFEGNEPLFNEFLKEIWKDQVASFLLEREIELFDTIDEFKRDNDVESRLTTFRKSDESCRLALAKLNLVYNRLSINRKTNDEIRFGDIFLLNLDANTMIYLLCLTPHCDCLRPTKIKNSTVVF